MRPLIAALLLSLTTTVASAAEPLVSAEQSAAIDLDRRLFDAYNHCDLVAFSKLFAPDVEFYHDTGGVTHTRDEVVDNTKKYICGKVRRELVDGTLHGYPIKGYGLLVTGEHRFCDLTSGKCEGIAEFTIIWQRDGDDWRATRVLSYGHRTAP